MVTLDPLKFINNYSMANVSFEPIGNITIKKIRDFILDNNLDEFDSVVIAKDNYDDIVFEYRKTFNESIPNPYYLIGILVKEKNAMLNYIDYIKNDPERYEGDSDTGNKNDDFKFSYLDYNDKILYRCGWCGNIVDSNGYEFDSNTRLAKIEILEKFYNRVSVTAVHGKCCPNGEEKAMLARQNKGTSGFELLTKMQEDLKKIL